MTGFGRCELKSAQGSVRVEIKTTNHKFLEISSRLPGHLTEFEDTVRKLVSEDIKRGKVNLFVSSPDPLVSSSRLMLNEALAKEVFHKIQRLRNVLKLHIPLRSASEESQILREVLHYPDVVTKDVSSTQRRVLFKDIQKAISRTLENLNHSRILEGRALERDLSKRLLEMEKALKVIEKRIPALTGEFKKFLESKMKEFLKSGEVDHERLTLEVALYVKNSDVSEEVTRLKHHIDAMKKALKENGEVGRKIDFIAQEMYRESNTLGAKSSDVLIANHVIQLKSAIEKIREQAQNVE